MYNGLLIGNKVTITASSDPSLLNRAGRILDETKNTLVIEERGNRIRVSKAIIKFTLESVQRPPLHLVGAELIGTMDERIKG